MYASCIIEIGSEFSLERRDDERDEKDKRGGGDKRFQTESGWFAGRNEISFVLASPRTEPYRMNEIISGDGANLF